MSKRSITQKIIVLMLITIIGFGNPRTVYAGQVLQGAVTLNEASTAITNKYGITGEIIKIDKEAISTVILTKDGLFYINNGKPKKYSISGSMTETTSFYKSGQDVYISPVMQTDATGKIIYVEIKVNLDNRSEEVTTNYSELMDKLDLRWTPNRISTFTDADNNKWINTFYNFSSPFSELYRIDTSGRVQKVAGSDRISYDSFSDYGNLSVDVNKKVYYTYTGGSVNGTTTYVDKDGNKSKVISYVYRLDNKLNKKGFEVYGPINDYEVGPAGDVWVLSGSKTLIHFDKNGNKVAKIALANGKDISIEPSGSIYVLDDNLVKLIYKDKLYTKFTLDSGYRFHELYMLGKDSLVASNENFFEMINGSNKETVASDAAVKYKPYIVKDNKGNITILSKNIDTQEDTDLKVYQIGNSGISYHSIYRNLGEYDKAVAYDGTIYIPNIKDYQITINLLKSDLKTEKFIEVTSFLPMIEMQIDAKKNLYILNNQTVIKISPTKKVQSADITDMKGGYNSQIIGFIKDKYGNMYVKYVKSNNDSSDKSYGLLNVNDILKVKQTKLTANDSYANLIFVTSKNEIAMINREDTKGNQMYIIDSNGNPVKNTSYDGTSYYTPRLVSQLEKIWKASDGTIFYERYLEIRKKTKSEEIWLANIEQAMDNNSGTIFYTDYSNVYVYDKLLPKVTTASPANKQIKVSTMGKITLQISEPVMKNNSFHTISLSNGGTKVSVRVTLIDNKIVITPKSILKSKTNYTVILPAKAIKDVAGNVLSGDYTCTFTTQ